MICGAAGVLSELYFQPSIGGRSELAHLTLVRVKSERTEVSGGEAGGLVPGEEQVEATVPYRSA